MAQLSLHQITKRLGQREVVKHFTITVNSGELLTLLGPSGSGKTTVLRMTGGFLTPDSGTISLDGDDITHLSPEKRPTAMVFQQYALWPHMTVFDNVAFGLKVRRRSAKDISERVRAMLSMMRLDDFARSFPAQLSGGQQQRVALARALAIQPSVLLLDEPLSNLDAQLRHDLRDEIRRIQQHLMITTIFVTHDQDEALSLSDRVAILRDGQLEQCDTPETLYRSPATEFVARFIGQMNFIRNGQIKSQQLLNLLIGSETGEWPASVSATGSVTVAIRPEAIRLTSKPEGGWRATLHNRVVRGAYTEWVFECALGTLKAWDFSHHPKSEPLYCHIDDALFYDSGRLVYQLARNVMPSAKPGCKQSSCGGLITCPQHID